LERIERLKKFLLLKGIYNSSSFPITTRTDPQPEIVGALRDVAPVELQVVSEKELNPHDDNR
jgi:hypothetical protein